MDSNKTWRLLIPYDVNQQTRPVILTLFIKNVYLPKTFQAHPRYATPTSTSLRTTSDDDKKEWLIKL